MRKNDNIPDIINDDKMIINRDANTLENVLKDSKTVESIQQILLSLISDKENLTLKTEIINPFALTMMKGFSELLEVAGYSKASAFVIGIINTYLEYMVSNKRKSRKEIIHALTSWIEKFDTSQNQQLLIKSEV